MSLQDSQIPADHGAETSGDHGAQTASDQGIQTPADDPPGDAAIAATGTQAAVQASMENLPQEKGTRRARRRLEATLQYAGLAVEEAWRGGEGWRARLLPVATKSAGRLHPANAGRSLGARSPSGNPLGREAVPAPISGGAELEKKEMSSSQDEPPHELENQFILRLPMEHASTVRKMVHSGSSSMKNKLKIDLFSDTRHAIVEVDNVSLAAKLVDLPCVIGSLKTLDRKSFYKTADVSQMLVCTADADVQPSPEEPVTSTDPKAIRKAEKQRKKKYTWKHGITPPLRNVRKRKFRKTIKKVADFKQIEEMDLPVHIESPEVEKEVKRLLCSDAEAVNARWEVIAEDETKEIESQGSIPGYAIASGMSDYKQRHTLPEYYVLQEMRNDSSNNTEEDDKDEEEEEDYDDEEEEDYYDEDMERELQTRFTEYDQYEAKEGTSSMVMEIQKYTQYAEKMLHEIQRRAQRQKDLIRKVENLTLKNHLHSVLEQLKLQEEEKTEQLSYLQEKLNYFLKK